MQSLVWFAMQRAVHLYDQLRLVADKVGNVALERYLSPELPAVQAMRT